MIARMSSGSSRADIAVEPTRSQNMTVSWRRSAASTAGGGPIDRLVLALLAAPPSSRSP